MRNILCRVADVAVALILAPLIALGGCAAQSASTTKTDVTLGLSVAAALVQAYDARSDANPQTVAELARLLSAAQAAAATYEASSAPADQTALESALSALATYESAAAK